LGKASTNINKISEILAVGESIDGRIIKEAAKGGII